MGDKNPKKREKKKKKVEKTVSVPTMQIESVKNPK